MVTVDQVADQISVWFRLTDSKGNTFKNTSASLMSLAPGSIIDHLRMNIKATFPELLDGISALQLHVFRNKESLTKSIMKRESGAQDLSLRTSTLLEGLETDDLDHALIVVVPDHAIRDTQHNRIAELRSDHAATHREVGTGLHQLVFLRSEWFISDLASHEPAVMLSTEEGMAMLYNGIVSHLEHPLVEQLEVVFMSFEMEFPIVVIQIERQRIFVRPCYELLFELLVNDIKQGRHRVSITGNPGVGKSQFYAYCTLRFSQGPLPEKESLPGKEPNCLIITASNVYYLFENDAFRKLSTAEVLAYQMKTNVIRLIDGHAELLSGWRGVSILFTSPGCPGYHGFMKNPGSEYVMPPWTYKELSIAAPMVTQLESDEVQKRFHLFGGIARHVFALEEPDFDSIVGEAMSTGDLMQITGSVAAREHVNEKEYSHVLVHMYPIHKNGAYFKGNILRFASHKIADQVYKRMLSLNRQNLVNFLLANQGDANSSSLQGKLFEIHCHHLWVDPGDALLVGRSLTNDHQIPHKRILIRVPKMVKTIKFQDLMGIPKFENGIPLYCQPLGGKYPCIDAIYWNGQTCILLQMTILESHSILHAPMTKILEWCEQQSLPTIYVLVVPSTIVDAYQPQKCVTDRMHVVKEPKETAKCLAQYAVGIHARLPLDSVEINGFLDGIHSCIYSKSRKAKESDKDIAKCRSPQ